MPSAKTVAWIDRMIWILIYGGLFVAILGLASWPESLALAWSLVVIGGITAAAGVVLLWIRSRLGSPG